MFFAGLTFLLCAVFVVADFSLNTQSGDLVLDSSSDTVKVQANLHMGDKQITNIGSYGTFFDTYGQLVIAGDTLAVKFQDGGGNDRAQIWWNNGSNVWRFKTANAAGIMTDRFYIKGNANSTQVGVDRSPTTYAFEIEGDASKTVAGDWLANSDARLKKNRENLTGALNVVLALRPVVFEWLGEGDLNLPAEYKGETNLTRLEEFVSKENFGIPADKIRSINLHSFPRGRQMGFIAQESKSVVPQFVQEDKNGFMMMTYGSFDPLLVSAIQELKGENDLLKQELCSKDNTYSFCK
jgi:hypothetical protein